MHRTLIIRSLIGLIVFALVCVLGLHFYARYAFAQSYEAYAQAAKRHDDAAYIPGVAENDIRKELNVVLARVLSEEMTAAERLSLARRGKALLDAAEGQIDEIGEIGTDVMVTIQNMREKADIPGGFNSEDEIENIIELSEERLNIIGDIRGLSYRAQFTTGQIFKQVIDDGGELDPAYVEKLNQELPEVEEQYNMRTNFYSDLEDVGKRIAETYKTFDGSF